MRLCWLVVIGVFGCGFVQAQSVNGDYSGTLGPLHLKLHVKPTTPGAFEATLDSLDQGAMGLQCVDVLIKGNDLSFNVPSVGGKWHGTVSEGGSTLSGIWSQGQDMPLVFRRDEPIALASKPSPVDGIWLGTLKAGENQLRVQLHLSSDRSGNEIGSLDSLDQGAMGLECKNVRLDGKNLTFDVPLVNGHWTGTLGDNANALDGTWTQVNSLPLRFTRQASPIAMKGPEPPAYDKAIPPVPVSGLQAVLDGDLGGSLHKGSLAPETGAGVVIGVLQHGVRRFFVFGAAKEDQLFEIGSISKTFTGLVLAQLVEQHQVRLDEPVRLLLPPGTVPKPDGPEITLVDLATQHSGLPRLPDNLRPEDGEDPYADYRPANLYAFLSAHGVSKSPDAKFLYSNLGFGLLGQALANSAKLSYPELLKKEVTGPLLLADTVVELSPEQKSRFAQGHSGRNAPVHPWTFDAFVGAGGIRSTASDMLRYLDAQLHPNHLTRTGATPASATISQAIAMTHELRADAMPGMKIGMAWFHKDDTGAYWHNGSTGGFSSYALFNPKEDYAVLVLFNRSISPEGSFADTLGEHVAARLSGHPAVLLK